MLDTRVAGLVVHRLDDNVLSSDGAYCIATEDKLSVSTTLYSGHFNGRLVKWDLRNDRVLSAASTESDRPVCDISCGPGLVACGAGRVGNDIPGSSVVNVWGVNNPKKRLLLHEFPDLDGHPRRVTSLHVWPDSSAVYALHADSSVNIALSMWTPIS